MLTDTPDSVEEDLRFYKCLDQFWHPVARESEIGDAPLLVVLLDKHLIIARINGVLVALDDRCIHRGASLSLGAVEGSCIRCSYHGWAYNADGEVIEVPANPAVSDSLSVGLNRYQCVTRYGLVWVSLSAQPMFDIPVFPHFDSSDFRVISCDPYEWDCASVRRLENYVDFGHLAWVHDGYLGSRDKPEVGVHKTWREDGVLRCEATVVEPPSGKMKKHLSGLGDLITARNEYWIYMPHSVLLDRHFDGGARYVLFMTASPISSNRTKSFWFIGRNYAMEPEADHEFLDFEWDILGQDKPIVESLTPDVIPSQLGKEMYVKTADAVTLGYRQWLTEISDPGAVQ